MNLKVFSAAKIGILFLVLLNGCKSNSKTDSSENIIQVGTTPAVLENGKIYNDYSTNIEGIMDVKIRSQISGYLQHIYVDEGSLVKKGQLLFKIDDRPYREKLNQAVAVLAVNRANLKKAKIDYERKLDLSSNQIISNVQLMEAKAELESIQAVIQQSQAEIDELKVNLEFCEIKAPMDGFLGRIPNKLGSLISSNTPEPLNTISSINKVNAYFSMSEKDYSAYLKKLSGANLPEKLENADSVDLILTSGSPYTEKGKITAVMGQFDKGTGAIQLRAVFNNPAYQLKSGNTGVIRMSKDIKDVFKIPKDAVLFIQDKKFVFIIDKDSKAKQLFVTVSGNAGDFYYVIGDLNDGQKIIYQNVGLVSDGAKVSVNN